jgi:hypothetical protein
MIHEQLKILNMKREEILEKAIQQFAMLTGAVIKVLPGEELVINGNTQTDTAIELKTVQQKTKFWVELKNEVRETILPHLLKKQHNNRKEWLLICQYIPKPMKENLKSNGFNYLETAGNCFIQKDGLFFYINDRAVTEMRQHKEGKLWKQAGLKFLFAILQNEELLNKTHRYMAEATKVALGNIGPFIQELKEEGYLKDAIDNRLIIENKELLRNKWVELFNAILKPKLRLGKFRFIDNKMMQDWKKIKPKDFRWGGETAGALWTNFLQPEIFTIYTNEPKMKIMQQLKLVPDVNGNVELMEKFWHPVFDDGNKVPALLAYAELVTSIDSRNRETAERLKQNLLA